MMCHKEETCENEICHREEGKVCSCMYEHILGRIRRRQVKTKKEKCKSYRIGKMANGEMRIV